MDTKQRFAHRGNAVFFAKILGCRKKRWLKFSKKNGKKEKASNATAYYLMDQMAEERNAELLFLSERYSSRYTNKSGRTVVGVKTRSAFECRVMTQ